MKYRITFFLFVLFGTPGFSKVNSYQPFQLNSAQWSETTWWETFCNGNYVTCSKDFEYRTVGDTIINKIMYAKLYVYGGTDWLACNVGNTSTNSKYDSLVGYIREDSNRRIYYCSPQKHINDTLLYNFNLKKGDTLPDTYICKKVRHYKVAKIDSMLVGDIYRKVYMISSDSGRIVTKLIEGVGSSTGFLEPIKVSFEAGCSLNEYKCGNVRIQPGLNNETLDNYSTLLKVYTDNSKEMFTITYKLPKDTHEALLKLYNIRGELMNIKPVNAGESPVTDSNMGNLLSGIYYYTLSANNKVLASYKFVVVK